MIDQCAADEGIKDIADKALEGEGLRDKARPRDEIRRPVTVTEGKWRDMSRV